MLCALWSMRDTQHVRSTVLCARTALSTARYPPPGWADGIPDRGVGGCRDGGLGGRPAGAAGARQPLGGGGLHRGLGGRPCGGGCGLGALWSRVRACMSSFGLMKAGF